MIGATSPLRSSSSWTPRILFPLVQNLPNTEKVLDFRSRHITSLYCDVLPTSLQLLIPEGHNVYKNLAPESWGTWRAEPWNTSPTTSGLLSARITESITKAILGTSTKSCLGRPTPFLHSQCFRTKLMCVATVAAKNIRTNGRKSCEMRFRFQKCLFRTRCSKRSNVSMT
jgi:hypothetical protein